MWDNTHALLVGPPAWCIGLGPRRQSPWLFAIAHSGGLRAANLMHACPLMLPSRSGDSPKMHDDDCRQQSDHTWHGMHADAMCAAKCRLHPSVAMSALHQPDSWASAATLLRKHPLNNPRPPRSQQAPPLVAKPVCAKLQRTSFFAWRSSEANGGACLKVPLHPGFLESSCRRPAVRLRRSVRHATDSSTTFGHGGRRLATSAFLPSPVRPEGCFIGRTPHPLHHCAGWSCGTCANTSVYPLARLGMAQVPCH